MKIFFGIIRESWLLFQTMAPYLLFGFLFAGILKVVIPQEKILSFLGKGKFRSSLNGSLIGMPLPLCSCGVIPAAASLRKQGADKGATLSFLISTPTTGIDSIFATYALLGPVFTIFRVISSFIIAVVCGIVTNILLPDKGKKIEDLDKTCSTCSDCSTIESYKGSFNQKIKHIFSYAFVELIDSTGKWLVVGIILGGVIAYLMPDDFIYKYLGSNWTAMFIMLLVGIPIYICSTGSIPVVAALMLKGMSPGAGLVFLIAGPATNTVTITVIAKELGKKEVVLYLVIISIGAILSGIVLNMICSNYQVNPVIQTKNIIPSWINTISSVLLGSVILFSFIKKWGFFQIPNSERHKFIVEVPDMSCQHCVNSIKDALNKIGIQDMVIDLKNKKILIDASLLHKREQIINAIASVGFKPYIGEPDE